MITYTVSKERGSSRWYAHPVGKPYMRVEGSVGSKKKALHAAAEMEMLDYRQYMKLWRKENPDQ